MPQNTRKNRPRRLTPREKKSFQQDSFTTEFSPSESILTSTTVEGALKELARLLGIKVRTITADSSTLLDDGVILGNCLTQDITLTLPDPSLGPRSITLTRIDDNIESYILTLVGFAGEAIRGESSIEIAFQWSSLTCVNNGVTWTFR